MDRRATPSEAGNRNQNQFLSVGRKVTTAFMPIYLCCDPASGRRNPSPAEARRATTNTAMRITTSASWRARATQHARVCATALPPTTPTRRPSGGGGGDGGGARHRRFPSPRERRRESGREEQGGSSTEELRQKAHRHTAADRPPHTNKGGDKKNPDSETPETQSPSTHRRPDKTQTKTGGRSPDQTRPTARPRDRQTHPERTYFADGRRSGPLVLAGASTSAPCAGYDAGRDGSRPSRPPHGHARCSRRGRTRLRGRERPPAQLQGVARSCNLRDIGGFASILSCFVTSHKLN